MSQLTRKTLTTSVIGINYSDLLETPARRKNCPFIAAVGVT